MATTRSKTKISGALRKSRAPNVPSTNDKLKTISSLLERFSKGKTVTKAQLQAALPESIWKELQTAEAKVSGTGSMSPDAKKYNLKLSRYKTAAKKVAKALLALKNARSNVIDGKQEAQVFAKAWTADDTNVLAWKVPELRVNDINASKQSLRQKVLLEALDACAVTAKQELMEKFGRG